MSIVKGIELVFNNRQHVTVDNMVKGANIVGSDAYDGAKSFVKGARAVEAQMIHGMVRTIEGLNVFNSDRQIQIAGENEAFVALIETTVRGAGKGLTTPLTYLVGAAIEGFVRSLPEEPKMRMAAEISANAYAKYRGKALAKALQKELGERIIRKVVSNKAFKALAKRIGLAAGTAETGIGLPIALFLTQGFLEESSKASRRLQLLDPTLFNKLRGAPPSLGTQTQRLAYVVTPNAGIVRDHLNTIIANQSGRAKLKQKQKPAGIDMLYYLAEPYLKPYISAAVIARNNKEVMAKIFDLLGKS